MSNFGYSYMNMVKEKLSRSKQFLQSNYELHMVHISGSQPFYIYVSINHEISILYHPNIKISIKQFKLYILEKK